VVGRGERSVDKIDVVKRRKLGEEGRKEKGLSRQKKEEEGNHGRRFEREESRARLEGKLHLSCSAYQ
jgi:hypothetical protein